MQQGTCSLAQSPSLIAWGGWFHVPVQTLPHVWLHDPGVLWECSRRAGIAPLSPWPLLGSGNLFLSSSVKVCVFALGRVRLGVKPPSPGGMCICRTSAQRGVGMGIPRGLQDLAGQSHSHPCLDLTAACPGPGGWSGDLQRVLPPSISGRCHLCSACLVTRVCGSCSVLRDVWGSTSMNSRAVSLSRRRDVLGVLGGRAQQVPPHLFPDASLPKQLPEGSAESWKRDVPPLHPQLSFRGALPGIPEPGAEPHCVRPRSGSAEPRGAPWDPAGKEAPGGDGGIPRGWRDPMGMEGSRGD